MSDVKIAVLEKTITTIESYIESHKAIHERDIRDRKTLIQDQIDLTYKPFEKDFDHLKNDVSEIKSDLKTIVTKLDTGWADYKKAINTDIKEIKEKTGLWANVKQLAALIVLGVVAALQNLKG